ncbi:MAG: hypothetical protein JSR45_13925 [Proteobacteria bacterium]|nr:hypothetical protein [Pseudomonadota bacterium]
MMSLRFFILLGLAAVMWVGVAVVVARGQDWREPVAIAAFGTLCLSGFDVVARRKPGDGKRG